MNDQECTKVEVWTDDLGSSRPPEIKIVFRMSGLPEAFISLDIAKAEKLAQNLRETLDSFYRRVTW